MKRVMGAAVLLLTVLLVSCGPRTGPPAMSLEFNGRTTEFSTNVYSYYLSYMKTRMLISMFAQFGVGAHEMHALYLSMPPMDDEFSEVVQMQAEAAMKEMLAIVAFAREHDLTLTARQLSDIDEYISNVIHGVFGRSRTAFNDTLRRFGINEDIFRQIRRYELLTGVVHRHLFDPVTGTWAPILPDLVAEIYESTFARFNHIAILTHSFGEGGDGEIAIVPLPEEELAERREHVRAMYNRIIESGNDAALFERLIESYSEDIMPHGLTISAAGMIRPHENIMEALFDMEIGDVRMVETEGSIHIMKRYPLLPPEQAPDLDNPGSSISQVITRDVERFLLLNQELAPFLENITVHEENTRQISARTSDVMFDVLGWIEAR